MLACVFPFPGKKLLQIKKPLLNSIESTLPYCKFKTVFKSSAKIIKQICFKEVLPTKLCSGIFYSFKCNDCQVIYFSKTKRNFYVTVVEHMGFLHLTKKCVKNVKKSAVSSFTLSLLQHKFWWSHRFAWWL